MYSAFCENPGTAQQHPQSAPQLQINEAEATSLLQHLNKDELRHLLESESKLDDLVRDLQQVKKIQGEKNMLIASNKSLAEYNLSKKPRFTELKARVATAYEDANKMKTELAKDVTQLDGTGQGQSLDTILALLQTATAEAEESSEGLADDLYSKKVDVESFVESYIQIRKVAHIRRVQAEKMAELLQNGLRHETHAPTNYNWNSSQSSPSGSHAPYPHGFSNTPYPAGPPVSGSAPYPAVSSFRMPEPMYR